MEHDEPLPAWLIERLDGRRPGRAVASVLHSLATQPRLMSFASTSRAAELAGVNVATVVRAAQQLGFSGWPALRAELRSRYLARLSASEVLAEHADAALGPAAATIQRELQNLQDLALLIDEAQIERVGAAVATARASLVIGSGSFAAPGLQFAHLMQTIGHDVRLQQRGGTALLNAASLLRPGDCLIAVQLWRTPHEIRGAVRVAVDAGATIVIVTDQAGGLADLADEVIAMPSEGASMFPSLVGAVTVLQAITAAVVAHDPQAAQAASDASERRWREHRLFPEPGR